MKAFIGISAAIFIGLLATGCAGGAASFFSLDGKRTIEVRISAGGLGEIVNWKSSYEGKPVANEAAPAK